MTISFNSIDMPIVSLHHILVMINILV